MRPQEIKALRLGLELTQVEFANKIGVCFATVNRWENGHKKPTGLSVKVLENINKV